jgi:hypothetical protein
MDWPLFECARKKLREGIETSEIQKANLLNEVEELKRGVNKAKTLEDKPPSLRERSRVTQKTVRLHRLDT